MCCVHVSSTLCTHVLFVLVLVLFRSACCVCTYVMCTVRTSFLCYDCGCLCIYASMSCMSMYVTCHVSMCCVCKVCTVSCVSLVPFASISCMSMYVTCCVSSIVCKCLASGREQVSCFRVSSVCILLLNEHNLLICV